MRLLVSKGNRFLFSTLTSCEQSLRGCGTLQEFRGIMLDTFRKNIPNIERIVETQGINSNMLLLSTLDDHEIPESIYKKLVNSLVKSDQKITSQDYKYLLQRLPAEKQLLEIYQNPSRQFTSQSTFKINNTVIDTHVLEEGLSLDYQNYDKMFLEKASHVFDEKPTQEKERGELVTRFRGEELNSYIRGIISEHQLFYAEDIDEFLFKYNDKLLKHYPSNTLFRYAMRSKRYPLDLHLIDLPHIFIMEDISEKKSLRELENTLESANLLNLLCKMRATNNPQSKCPKALRNSNIDHLSMPDGYYPYLARDADLFSKSKVEYMMTAISDIIQESGNKKQAALLVLSNQYAPFVREALKQYEATGQLGHQRVTLDSLQKHIMSRNTRLEQDSLGVPLKKSIITEILFEVNAMETLEYYKSLGDDVAQQYFQALQEYNGRMTLQALDPTAGSKLQTLFSQGAQCQLLQLIFGNEEEFPETAYTEQTIKRIFSTLDHQTSQKGESGKIKLNKDL